MSQTELPLEPEHQRDDVVPGPRVPARYGSYATSIRRSTREWRVLERGDTFSWSGRWRPINDYTDIDCLVGKWGRIGAHEGLVCYDDEEGGEVQINGYPARVSEVEVVEDGAHLNAFERTLRLYDFASDKAGAIAAVLSDARAYRQDQAKRIRSTGGALRAALLDEFGWTEADLERE